MNCSLSGLVFVLGTEVVNLGFIDTPEKALEADHLFRLAGVDLIFLYVATYAYSATVLPVARCAKVPVIVLNLQPAAALDCAAFNAMGGCTAMTGEWVAHCAVGVGHIADKIDKLGRLLGLETARVC